MLIRRAIVGGGGWAPPPPLPPGWNPGDIAGIIDYFLYSDTSRLKQDTAGTIAVTSAGQDVKWWRGQLDVITLTASGSSKGIYTATGIDPSSSNANFLASYSSGASTGKFVAIKTVEAVTTVEDKTHLVGFFTSANGRVCTIDKFCSTTDAGGFSRVTPRSNVATTNPTDIGTVLNPVYVFNSNGGIGSKVIRKGGEETTISSTSVSGTALAGAKIGGFFTYLGSPVKFLAYGSQEISAVDLGRLVAYMNSIS